MEIHKKHYDTHQLHIMHHELEHLQLLEDNFINEPKIDHYPFPKVLSAIDDTITMNNCGINAKINLFNFLKSNKDHQIPINLNNQIECIISNLRNINLMHRDIKPDNVCINKKGQISLIDFSHINKDPDDSFFKKPNLNELKHNLNYSYLDYIEERGYELDGDKGYKNWFKSSKPWRQSPWSMIYMFSYVRK